jgi:hypothetical protein
MGLRYPHGQAGIVNGRLMSLPINESHYTRSFKIEEAVDHWFDENLADPLTPFHMPLVDHESAHPYL